MNNDALPFIVFGLCACLSNLFVLIGPTSVFARARAHVVCDINEYACVSECVCDDVCLCVRECV